MINIRDIAMAIIRNNPQIANNPRTQEMVQVIQNGDEEKGEEIARNLCKSYGVTPQQATENAKAFFRIF